MGTRGLRIAELEISERPRERLVRLGAQALSNAELVAILLRTGTPGASALEVGQRLLALGRTEGMPAEGPAGGAAAAGAAGAAGTGGAAGAGGAAAAGGAAGIGGAAAAGGADGTGGRRSEQDLGLRYLVTCALDDLRRVPGVGLAKAVQIKAAVELGRRIATASAARVAVRSPRDVSGLVMEEMRYLDREQFRIVLLDSKNQVLGLKVVSVGSLSSSIVHPREVFKEAITRSSAAVILVHNHPSGDPTPSQEDIEVTRRLADAGRLLGIEVLDHIVVGDNRYVSFKEKGIS